MQEYFDEAVILSKEPVGEADAQVVFFSRHAGKLSGKAKSVRKITSKLAAHLEPGNVVQVRWVEKGDLEKGGLQVIEALKTKRLEGAVPDMHILQFLLAEGVSDEALWEALTSQPFSWRAILAALGWDPAEAVCHSCGKSSPDFFYPATQEFFCQECVRTSRVPRNEVLSIGN